MRGKKLARQMSKSLDFEEIESQLPSFRTWLADKKIKAPEGLILLAKNFTTLLDSVEQAYDAYEATLNQTQRNLEMTATEAEQKSRQLMLETQKSQALLKQVDRAVFTIDSSGLILAPISDQAKALFARPIIGHSIFEILGTALARNEVCIEEFRKSIIAMFAKPHSDWEKLSHGFPKKLTLTSGKVLTLSLTPLMNEINQVENIMCFIDVANPRLD